MRGNLWDDPRVARLCDITYHCEAAVVGALYWLWATADQHTEDGLLVGLTTRQIDRKTGVLGIGAALVEVGWVIVSDAGAQIVRFDEHNGASAKRRCSESRRKMSARDADKEQTDSGIGADKSQQSSAPRERDREEGKPTSSLRSEGAESADEKSGPPAANENDDSLLSAIFEVGLPAMVSGGCSDKSARSLLGKLRKELGDLEALVAVEAMRRESPLDAAAWVSGAIKARRTTAVSLDAFMAGCRERGESVVSGYQPIFDYAEKAGIPEEFIRLAWDEFKRRHMPGGIWSSTKREDWRLSFLAALQTNALRLWYADQKSGALLLTAAGLQADMAGRVAA